MDSQFNQGKKLLLFHYHHLNIYYRKKMLTLLFRYFNLCLRFRFGNSASDFALRNMKAEHIKMIDELEEQGCLVVVLDRFQTAGLKRDDYGYIRFVMTERAEGAIECIRDTEAAKEIRKIDHN